MKTILSAVLVTVLVAGFSNCSNKENDLNSFFVG
jgi:hypothetical protein